MKKAPRAAIRIASRSATQRVNYYRSSPAQPTGANPTSYTPQRAARSTALTDGSHGLRAAGLASCGAIGYST
jgi:hypothetical protein